MAEESQTDLQRAIAQAIDSEIMKLQQAILPVQQMAEMALQKLESDERLGYGKWIPGIPGGGGVNWSVFAFGAEVVSGANNYISVTGGEVRHGTRATIEVAAAPFVKIVSDHYLVFVSYTIGSAAAIGSGAVCPVDTSTIIYWPLHKWRLIDGVASLEMIYHLGVIKIPGVFA